LSSAYEFTIPGPPVGKGRPRMTARHGIARSYTPAKTVAYEQLVREAWLHAGSHAVFPPDVPLWVWVHAWFAVPKSASKARRAALLDRGWCLKKPDGDNILKVVTDALNGIAYHDDAQVVDARVLKRYTDGEPRVVVKIGAAWNAREP